MISVLVGIRGSYQVAVGAMTFVCPIGGAGVVLLIWRWAVILIGAGLYVAAVVFRHLRKRKGRLEITFFSSLKFLSVSLSEAAKHNGVINGFCM